MTTRERVALGASGATLIVALVMLWVGLGPTASAEACEARVRQVVAAGELPTGQVPECEGLSQEVREEIFARIMGDAFTEEIGE